MYAECTNTKALSVVEEHLKTALPHMLATYTKACNIDVDTSSMTHYDTHLHHRSRSGRSSPNFGDESISWPRIICRIELEVLQLPRADATDKEAARIATGATQKETKYEAATRGKAAVAEKAEKS